MEEFDVIVIGSGAAGLTAAVMASERGARKVGVFEKADLIGGTTAWSGIMQLRQGKEALDANTESLDKNNRLRNSEAWDRLNTEVLEWNKIFAEDEDICSIWLSGEEKMTELPVTERMRYQHLFNMSMYTHQSAYSRAKMLDNEEMADHAIESFAETLKIEGGTMQIWKHYNQTDEFGEKINEYLKTIAT